MSYLDEAFLPKTSNPFPQAPDPMFAPTKAKAKKDIKTAITSADPYDTFSKGSTTPDPSQGDILGHQYKFTPVTNPNGEIQSYSETDPTGTEPMQMLGMAQEGGVLQHATDPKTLTPAEYDKLTVEASKGNKLAQQILVSGHYKANDFPTLGQDLKKIEDPFVQALSGMPALAENMQGQMNAITQPYDFTNAEAQVNNLLGQEGSTMRMSTSPETNTYLSKLSSIVGSPGADLTHSSAGLPSIMDALSGLGPAGKLSEGASPYASLLGALLSHQQYLDIYQGGLQQSNSNQNPAWLQALLASVTGQTAGGSVVSPQIAAAGIGAAPSTTPSPTGSTG
jgi:hypothetical protein